MLIKVMLLAAIAVVVGLGLRPPAGGRHQAVRRMAVLGFAVLAVLSVLFPDAWNAAAAVVGVGRGTDLLLYGLIVAFGLYMVTTYRRFRALETQITVLARRIAVDEAMPVIGPHGPDAEEAPGAPTEAEGGTPPAGAR